MSLSLKASGSNININLVGEEIIKYKFKYEAPNSKYAKSVFDCCMEIHGNISYMVEHSFEDLESIREWSRKEFDGEGYYSNVSVSFTHRDEVVRTTTFPNAYIVSYDEEITTHSGEGFFILVLKQKLDILDKIIIEPVTKSAVSVSKLDSIQPMPGNFLIGPQRGASALNHDPRERLNQIAGLAGIPEVSRRRLERAEQVILDNAEHILYAAQHFDVDPATLASVIFAVHALNVDWIDAIADVPVAAFGINTSVGVAQVRMETAEAIEEAGLMPVIAPVLLHDPSGFRHVYSSVQDRLNALRDPRTNVMYAAAYLRHQTNRWKDDFPEISNRPDILATVYNRTDTKPHDSPGSNEFGRFAAHNHPRMKNILGLN